MDVGYEIFFGDPTGFASCCFCLAFFCLTHRDATVAKLNLHFGQCMLSPG